MAQKAAHYSLMSKHELFERARVAGGNDACDQFGIR
jgi:hypothetical protein